MSHMCSLLAEFLVGPVLCYTHSYLIYPFTNLQHYTQKVYKPIVSKPKNTDTRILGGPIIKNQKLGQTYLYSLLDKMSKVKHFYLFCHVTPSLYYTSYSTSLCLALRWQGRPFLILYFPNSKYVRLSLFMRANICIIITIVVHRMYKNCFKCATMRGERRR